MDHLARVLYKATDAAVTSATELQHLVLTQHGRTPNARQLCQDVVDGMMTPYFDTVRTIVAAGPDDDGSLTAVLGIFAEAFDEAAAKTDSELAAAIEGSS